MLLLFSAAILCVPRAHSLSKEFPIGGFVGYPSDRVFPVYLRRAFFKKFAEPYPEKEAFEKRWGSIDLSKMKNKEQEKKLLVDETWLSEYSPPLQAIRYTVEDGISKGPIKYTDFFYEYDRNYPGWSREELAYHTEQYTTEEKEWESISAKNQYPRPDDSMRAMRSYYLDHFMRTRTYRHMRRQNYSTYNDRRVVALYRLGLEDPAIKTYCYIQDHDPQRPNGIVKHFYIKHDYLYTAGDDFFSTAAPLPIFLEMCDVDGMWTDKDEDCRSRWAMFPPSFHQGEQDERNRLYLVPRKGGVDMSAPMLLFCREYDDDLISTVVNIDTLTKLDDKGDCKFSKPVTDWTPYQSRNVSLEMCGRVTWLNLQVSMKFTNPINGGWSCCSGCYCGSSSAGCGTKTKEGRWVLERIDKNTTIDNESATFYLFTNDCDYSSIQTIDVQTTVANDPWMRQWFILERLLGMSPYLDDGLPIHSKYVRKHLNLVWDHIRKNVFNDDEYYTENVCPVRYVQIEECRADKKKQKCIDEVEQCRLLLKSAAGLSPEEQGGEEQPALPPELPPRLNHTALNHVNCWAELPTADCIAAVGADIVVECKRVPSETRITWHHGDPKSPFPVANTSEQRIAQYNKTLHLHNLAEEDLSTYECRDARSGILLGAVDVELPKDNKKMWYGIAGTAALLVIIVVFGVGMHFYMKRKKAKKRAARAKLDPTADVISIEESSLSFATMNDCMTEFDSERPQMFADERVRPKGVPSKAKDRRMGCGKSKEKNGKATSEPNVLPTEQTPVPYGEMPYPPEDFIGEEEVPPAVPAPVEKDVVDGKVLPPPTPVTEAEADELEEGAEEEAEEAEEVEGEEDGWEEEWGEEEEAEDETGPETGKQVYDNNAGATVAPVAVTPAAVQQVDVAAVAAAAAVAAVQASNGQAAAPAATPIATTPTDATPTTVTPTATTPTAATPTAATPTAATPTADAAAAAPADAAAPSPASPATATTTPTAAAPGFKGGKGKAGKGAPRANVKGSKTKSGKGKAGKVKGVKTGKVKRAKTPKTKSKRPKTPKSKSKAKSKVKKPKSTKSKTKSKGKPKKAKAPKPAKPPKPSKPRKGK